jgi:allantoin racemase
MRIMVISHAARRADAPTANGSNPALAQWNSYASPGTEVELGSPEPYARPDPNRDTGGTDRHLLWHVSVPAIVQKTVWAERNGYDAVIQSNHFEHGVEASRLAVRIPVLGLCRTTMHVAANIADRIGVTVPLDGYFVLARHLLKSYGLQDYVSGMRSLGFDDVPTPDQIPALRPAMFERTVEVMRALVKETGAECIVPLGGAVIPAILDPQALEREVGAPVLNPRPIGIRTAEMYVQLGLSQSPLTYTRAMIAPDDIARR